MSFIDLSILLFLAVVGIYGWNRVRSPEQSYLAVVLLTIAILFGFSSVPAIAGTNLAALGAYENTQARSQQIEESLKITPGGGHYSGIEHTERTADSEKAASDESIESTIEQYSSDNLTVAVANGSVKLSGQVENKEIAQHIVEQVKSIPGVYEVTYDLGLEDNAL